MKLLESMIDGLASVAVIAGVVVGSIVGVLTAGIVFLAPFVAVIWLVVRIA